MMKDYSGKKQAYEYAHPAGLVQSNIYDTKYDMRR